MRSKPLHLVTLATAMITLFLAGVGDARADGPDILRGTHPDKSRKYINISGQIGNMGELYSVSGRERRRPGSTGRIFFKPTINIYNTIDINLNLFLSTEGNGARQNINQIDLNPKWGWGEAHIVDFTNSYSQFTLNGIKIRGAGVDLNPGLFRFSLLSGFSNREISSINGTNSYRRQINGGKIGIGRDGGSYLDLIVLSARDAFSSADSIIIDTTAHSDSGAIDSTQNTISITPQENLSAALASKLSLKHLTWNNEIAGSAFTRDRRSPEWEQKNYPHSLRRFFVPRLSSSIDYAYSSDLALKISEYNFQAGYQYVGPGYVSLGLSSQSSDKQAIKLGVSRRLRAGAVKLNYTRQNDNLIGQKSFTTDRNNISLGALYKPVRIWNVNLNMSYVTMNNNAPDTASGIDFSNKMLQLGNSFSFDREKGLKNISLDYSFQTSGDSNPARSASALKSHTILVRGAYFPLSSVGLTPSINFVNTRQAAAGWTLTQSYTVGISVAGFNKKLFNNFQGGFTSNGNAKSTKFGLHSNYKLTRGAVVNGQFDVNRVSPADNSGSFTETTARLLVTQRF